MAHPKDGRPPLLKLAVLVGQLVDPLLQQHLLFHHRKCQGVDERHVLLENLHEKPDRVDLPKSTDGSIFTESE